MAACPNAVTLLTVFVQVMLSWSLVPGSKLAHNYILTRLEFYWSLQLVPMVLAVTRAGNHINSLHHVSDHL